MTATGTFIFICSACGYKARLPEQFAGRTIKCPGCQAPQVATAPSNVQRKTAVITRVAATPVPFTLPKDQEDALAGIPSATPVEMPASAAPTASRPFPSPLPGAIQVTTDRVTRMQTPVPGEAPAPMAKLATGGTVDFTCASCNARLRLPGHYAGKSILCPKCSSPQKVATAPEPMDTTRSLAQKADEPAAPAAPQPIPGPGTGIRAISVTPLPQPYPTPLPTQTPPPTPAVEAPAVGTAPVPAAPAAAVIEATPAEASAEDDVAISPSKSFVKPHPSKSATSRPRVATSSHTRTPEPVVAPAKSPIGLIATAGVLVVIAIGLAAGLVYHLLALGQTRERLATAEQDAKTAATREHEASLKLKELEERLADTERKLKAAEEAKAAAEAAAKLAEQPAEAKPADAEPAAEAPKPGEEAAPAAQP